LRYVNACWWYNFTFRLDRVRGYPDHEDLWTPGFLEYVLTPGVPVGFIASTKGVICSDVTGLVFDRVQVTPTAGPVYDLKNASDIVVRGAKAPAGTGVFLKLDGAGSRGVRLQACDLSAAKHPFVTGQDVPAGAVTVK